MPGRSNHRVVPRIIMMIVGKEMLPSRRRRRCRLRGMEDGVVLTAG